MSSSKHEIELQIYCRSSLARIIKENNEKFDAIVSITDKDVDLNEQFKRIKDEQIDTIRKGIEEDGLFLSLSFDDEDHMGGLAPTQNDVYSIIAFARSLNEKGKKRLAVHCNAGISRSTAASYIILHTLGYSRHEAVTTVLTTSPAAQPNKLMLYFFGDPSATELFKEISIYLSDKHYIESRKLK